jgi:hypothetical protein
MLLVAPGRLNPALVAEIRRFRAEIYAQDHVAVSDDPDEASYHVAVYVEGHLAGALRYTPLGQGTARMGGWCVSPKFRGTRVSLDLALAPFRVARVLGDRRGVAYATTRHGSAAMLRKLGGRVVETKWDAEYGCEMQRLEFELLSTNFNGAASRPDSIAA